MCCDGSYVRVSNFLQSLRDSIPFVALTPDLCPGLSLMPPLRGWSDVSCLYAGLEGPLFHASWIVLRGPSPSIDAELFSDVRWHRFKSIFVVSQIRIYRKKNPRIRQNRPEVGHPGFVPESQWCLAMRASSPLSFPSNPHASRKRSYRQRSDRREAIG
jgi:hypothetical protein